MNEDTPKWMVYNRKSIYKILYMNEWMILGYRHFKKPPCLNGLDLVGGLEHFFSIELGMSSSQLMFNFSEG